MNIQQLNNELGNVDIYLLDQILKNRIASTDLILDAGCGEGRNLIYFLNNGYTVHGIDQNEDAIRMLHFILGSKYPNYSKADFQTGTLEKLPYDDQQYQYVICSAVLHFAKSHEHFWQMMDELVRVTAQNGAIFIRAASDIGLTGHKDQGEGRYYLPDGSMRFLLTQSMIDELKSKYRLAAIEPTKTVVVDGMRCMTTLVLGKKES